MEFQVKLTRNAKLEIESAYLWFKNVNPAYADQWFKDLMNTIATLQDKPKRCAFARENDNFPEEIRQLIYGKSRNKYRIIFTIKDEIVYILYVRHSSQSSISFINSLLGDDFFKILADIQNQIEVTLTHDGVPLAKVMPLSSEEKVIPSKSPRTPGAWKGQIFMSDDFDDESAEINAMFYGEEE